MIELEILDITKIPFEEIREFEKKWENTSLNLIESNKEAFSSCFDNDLGKSNFNYNNCIQVRIKNEKDKIYAILTINSQLSNLSTTLKHKIQESFRTHWIPIQNPTDSLFHYTNSLEAVKGILLNGFFPRPNIEIFKRFETTKTEKGSLTTMFPDLRAIVSMVCLCDIPFSSFQEHCEFYGKYGIGVSLNWAVSNGFQPVHYQIIGSKTSSALTKLDEIGLNNVFFNLGKKDESEDLAIDNYGKTLTSLQNLLMYVKNIEVTSRNGVKRWTYSEREWRYVPPIEEEVTDRRNQFIPLSKSDDVEVLIETIKSHFESQPIVFNTIWNDIHFIILESESEIDSLIEFINLELKQKRNLTDREVNLLCTKITSYERMNKVI